MSNVSNIPLQNAYETTLENSMTTTQLTMTVTDGPDFALPAGQGVYAVIDPKNSFREVVLITGIVGTVLTVTRGQTDYSGGASTAQEHSGGAKVIITDSYHIFSEYATAINSKADAAAGVFTTSLKVPVYATTAARDVAIPAPANGMEVYVTADGKYYDYTAGSWVARESGGTFANASATVAGKVEMPSDAETIAGTSAGGTGALLAVNPANLLSATVSKTTSAGAGDTGKFVRANVSGLVDSTFMPYTSTVAEVNKLSGASANVTSTNLNTLTAGALSDATALHTHSSTAQEASGIAGETITVGQALAEIPYDVQWYAQLTDANLALGDDNARRRQAVKIIPARTVTGITSMQFRGCEIAGGSTTTLTFSIQTDNAGAPSGTVIANGTANAIDPSGWTGTYNSRTATFAAPPTLTKGTTYWLVWETSSTEAGQGLYLGVNSSYDENYCPFTRLTYNLDTATWGGSVTNATPFFWFYTTADTPLGSKLVVTDANFGRRTWNFVGMADAGYAAEATVTYYYEVVPAATFASAIEAGRDYFIDDDPAGGITKETANGKYGGNFNYKIGRGVMNSAGTVDLKISTGQKRIIIHESTEITATTTKYYALWFRPSLIIADMWQATGGAAVPALSHGYAFPAFSGILQGNIYLAGAAAGSDTNNLGYTAMGGNTFVLVCNAQATDIGFQLLYTEAGAAGVYAILDCTA